MEQQDELEIETRLRAALQARSELVTHSTLRPGVPPNEHTAGAKAARGAWWSWRRLLVPATVAAALAGGVFVGAALPHDSDKTVSSGGPGGSTPAPGGSSGPNYQGQSPAVSGTEASLNTLRFTLAAGWQVAPIDTTSACVLPKSRAVPSAGETAPAAGKGAGGGAAALPCGVDALYLKTDATAGAWPLSAVGQATGWWPGTVASASAITCPAARPDAKNAVKNSVMLRSSAKYVLSPQVTAEYHEWAVTCASGSGARPMLWKLDTAGTAPATTSVVATVVSSDPAYDSALLGMVGSLHLAS